MNTNHYNHSDRIWQSTFFGIPSTRINAVSADINPVAQHEESPETDFISTQGASTSPYPEDFSITGIEEA